MVTSIQMHENIIKELNVIKRELNLKSYEEVILTLLRSEKRLKKSYFGTFPELPEFKRDEEEDDRLG